MTRKPDFVTPDEVREIAVTLSDAVTSDDADEVLWQAQELAKAIDGLYDYQRKVQCNAVNRIGSALTPAGRAQVLAGCVLDAVDVCDYDEADYLLRQFRNEYECALALAAHSERGRV